MGALFGRAYSLNLNGILITQLRVAFSIVQTIKPQPNTSEITVYGLSQDTRSKLQQAGLPVSLEAGYGNDIAQIFLGQMRKATQLHVDANGNMHPPDSKVWDKKVGPTWESHFRSGDSEKEIREGKVSQSWSANTSITQIVKDLTSALGVSVGNALTQAASGDLSKVLTTYANGFVAQGNAFKKLQQVFNNLGYDVSIQNGVLQVLAPGGTAQVPAIVLSPSSGLVGSPEAGEQGIITCNSLLQAGYFPGRQVVLQSDEFNGNYRVEKVTHAGDTHAGDWQSKLELSDINSPQVTGNLDAEGKQ
jgi:hypothetical protein